jgi:hypothetical protein
MFILVEPGRTELRMESMNTSTIDEPIARACAGATFRTAAERTGA